MTNIQKHLWRMGIGNRLKGYKMVILAVELGVENEDRLQCAQEFLFRVYPKNCVNEQGGAKRE